MSRAVLKRQYDRAKRAQAIFASVQPDNLKTPLGIKISSSIARNSIKITIECNKALGTLISTLDDLLSCIGAAERTLDNL